MIIGASGRRPISSAFTAKSTAPPGTKDRAGQRPMRKKTDYTIGEPELGVAPLDCSMSELRTRPLVLDCKSELAKMVVRSGSWRLGQTAGLLDRSELSEPRWGMLQSSASTGRETACVGRVTNSAAKTMGEAEASS